MYIPGKDPVRTGSLNRAVCTLSVNG